MTSNNYSIIFSSVTGNTKKLADTIHETLPQDMCDYFGGNELQVPESDLFLSKEIVYFTGVCVG